MILKLIIEKLIAGRMVRRMELLVWLVVLPLEPTKLSGAFDFLFYFDCYYSIYVEVRRMPTNHVMFLNSF